MLVFNDFRDRPGRAAALLAVVCGVLFLSSGCSGGGSGKLLPSEWLPAILAEEAVALAGGDGDVQVLLLRMHMFGNPNVDAKAEEMVQALSLHKGLTVVGVESLGRDLDPMQATSAMMMGGLPLDEFVQAVKKHPGADVVISLDGGPDLRRGNVKSVAAGLPPLICMLANDEGVQPLLASGVADVVIVPQARGLVHEDPQTARELFENAYKIFKQ